MKIISEIINELMDVNLSLAGPLLKTKFLANKLKNSDLADWVNSELEGYSNTKTIIPNYRKFKGQVVGDFINGNIHYKSVQLHISSFPEDIQKLLVNFTFSQGVKSLETLLVTDKGGHLETKLPVSVLSMIQQLYEDSGNEYFDLLSVKNIIPQNCVNDVLTKIRSKLLDIMMNVDEEFGSETEIENSQENSNIVTKIINQTIYNNGDGFVFNNQTSGTNNANITINKGNKEKLEETLITNGIERNDISTLLEFIDIEKPNDETGIFSEKVNLWIQTMMGKVLNGTWQVGIGAAGNLLAETIKKYYGI